MDSEAAPADPSNPPEFFLRSILDDPAGYHMRDVLSRISPGSLDRRDNRATKVYRHCSPHRPNPTFAFGMRCIIKR
jgi:hypothetical protein